MPLTLLSCHFVHSSTYRFVLYLLIFILYFYVHFHRATRMNSADYAVARCLSVRLSVTRQYSVNTAEHILNFFLQSSRPAILLFPYQTVWQYSDGDPPNGGAQCKGGMKTRFLTNISLYLANDAS